MKTNNKQMIDEIENGGHLSKVYELDNGSAFLVYKFTNSIYCGRSFCETYDAAMLDAENHIYGKI